MENVSNIISATFERVWATLQVVAEMQEETARQMVETDRKMAETDRKMTETARIVEENGRQIAKLDKHLGGLSNNHGLFAEEYFYNSIKKGEKTLFGEKFDKLIKSELIEDDNKTKGELDMMLINGKAVAIIEVKFKAREKHIDRMFKKVKLFRDKFTEYQNHQVYLGLASMVFDEGIEDKCKENGIAIIMQVGDTVVIYDENLSTF